MKNKNNLREIIDRAETVLTRLGYIVSRSQGEIYVKSPDTPEDGLRVTLATHYRRGITVNYSACTPDTVIAEVICACRRALSRAREDAWQHGVDLFEESNFLDRLTSDAREFLASIRQNVGVFETKGLVLRHGNGITPWGDTLTLTKLSPETLSTILTTVKESKE